MPPRRPSKKVLSEQSVAASKAILEELGNDFADGSITLGELEASLKDEMKSEYIRQYLYGIGGLAYMTPDDWETVASDLEAQYRFADNFLAQLEEAQARDDDGETLAGMLWRFGLYALSAGTVYEFANSLSHLNNGDTEEIWHLDNSVTNHCEDCPEYARQGWQPIGTFPTPGDGTTACKNHCYCWKDYR